MSPLLLRRPSLVIVLLGVALLALLPAITSAQTTPPRHSFYGSVAEVTIDGVPWDGVSEIELIDQDGAVVDTVLVQGESWVAAAPISADTARFRQGAALSPILVVQGGHVTPLVLTLVADGPGRTVTLVRGFNFVTWTGATMAVEDALATLPTTDRVSAIFEFDAGAQSWDSFRPGAAAFLQSIAELRANGAYFFLMTGAVTWEMPVEAAPSGTETLRTGFNAIPWLGADNSAPAAALDAVANAGAVGTIFVFRAGTQSYQVFRPAGLAIPSDLTELDRYDVMFIQASAQTTITQ